MINIDEISASHNFISEETVDDILEAIAFDDPATINHATRLEILRRLRNLYAGVFTEHKLSSMQTRTDLNKVLKPLLRDTLSLQQRIKEDEIQWMNQLLSVVALDSYLASAKEETKDDRPEQNTYIPPPEILEQTAKQLGYLSKLLEHLSDVVDQFDGLDPDQHRNWALSATTEKDRYIREELLPYLRKGGGVGADTLTIVHIAEIYEYVFGKVFSVVSNYGKPAYEQRRGDIKGGITKPPAKEKPPQLKDLPRYSGTAIEFAYTVINALKLGGLIVPLTEDDLPPIPDGAGHNLNKSEYYDLPRINRERAFDREQSSRSRLVNRIGDLWTNQTKRTKRSVAKQTAEL